MSKDQSSVRWIYTARRIATQANAAGGAIVVDVTVPAGMTAELLRVLITNSGTNSAYISLLDEDNDVQGVLCSVASGAATSASMPRSFTTTTTNTTIDSSHRVILGPGAKLSMYQAGAGIQNDTLTIAVTMLMSARVEPTWSKARSTNEGSVTLAASTISTANTLQAVVGGFP